MSDMSELSSTDRVTLNRAKSAVLSRDYDLAEQLFKNLLAHDASNIEFLTELADLYVKNNRDSEALPVYQQILEIDPHNLNAINNLGCIYRRLKQFRDSMSVLEQGIIIDEKNVQLFYNLGLTYKDLGKNQRAVQCFEIVISQNPNDVLAYNNLGSIYLIENLYEKAIPVFQRGLKQDPNHPALHLNLARAYQKQGDFAKSIQEYEAALRARPGWLDAIDGFADLLLERSNTSKAQTLVENAIKLNPENAGMHTKMGRVYTQQSSFENAETEYNKALSIEPENTDALSGLADAYESDGKILDALHTMERYEKLEPESVKMLQQYTHILLSGNKLTSAHEKIKQIWARNPDDVQTLNLLGQYYICNGEDDKANGCFERINVIDPNYTLHYRDGALRYKQKGESEKVEKNLLKYLDTNENDSKALNMLASHYEDTSRYEDALGLYEKLSSIDEGNATYKNGLNRVNSIISGKSLKEDSDDENAVFQKNQNRISIDPFENPIDVDLEEENPAEEEVDELSPEYSSPIDFESLTVEDDAVSPFENIDDEILANNVRDDDFDSLLPETGNMRDEDDFFRENSFGDHPRSSSREDPYPKFESETLDDEYDRTSPIELEEDVEELEEEPAAPKPKMTEPEPEPQKKLDPEPKPEPEEIASEDSEGVEELPEEIASEDSEGFEELPEEIASEDSEGFEELPEEIASEDSEGVEELPEEIASEDNYDELESQYEPEEVEPEEVDNVSLFDNLDKENFDSLEEEIPSESEELLSLPSVEEQLEDIDSEEENLQELESLQDNSYSSGNAIDEIKNAINDHTAFEKYKKVSDMFIMLKSLVSYLPDEERLKFQSSKERLQLEYIIAKLQGKPGLLSVSDACRHELDDETDFADIDDENCNNGRKLAKFVLEYIRSMTKNLADYEIAGALDSQIADLLRRL
ncbi:MAG: tetratricopeptide repeat protein [Treponema sp.]|nr:tetratricopeptide repeat protein [Treponema sp.]